MTITDNASNRRKPFEDIRSKIKDNDNRECYKSKGDHCSLEILYILVFFDHAGLSTTHCLPYDTAQVSLQYMISICLWYAL